MLKYFLFPLSRDCFQHMTAGIWICIRIYGMNHIAKIEWERKSEKCSDKDEENLDRMTHQELQ